MTQTRTNPTPRRPGIGLALVIAVLLIAAATLYFVDPAMSGFYPACYFHRFTGLQCPGCGGLRAAHQLLHGQLGPAFKLNPLVPMLAPLGLGFLGWSLIRWLRGRPVAFNLSPHWLWAGLAALAAFGLLRNLF